MVINVNVKEKIIEVQSEFTMNELAEFIELYIGTDWILKLNPNNATKEEKKEEKEEKEEKKEFHYHYHYEYPYRFPYTHNWPFTYSWPYNVINYGSTATAATAGIPVNETITTNRNCATTVRTTGGTGGILTKANISSSFYNSNGAMSFTNGTYTKE